MTTLDRLYKKGLLSRTKDGLAWVYVPTKTREAFERAQADHLAARMLRDHGEIGLTAFVDAAADDAVLDRLERLIKEKLKAKRSQ